MLRSKLHCLTYLLAGIFFLIGAIHTQAKEDSSDLILVLDASGSMWGHIDGLNKIVIAHDVMVKSVEISGKLSQRFEDVVVNPSSSTRLAHAFQSGTLKVGAIRNGELVDATLKVRSVPKGKTVGHGRTYTRASSNPKTFTLLPGSYTVTVSEIKGGKKVFSIEIIAGETIQKMVESE